MQVLPSRAAIQTDPARPRRGRTRGPLLAMAERDYYDVLDVKRDATAEQVKKAYRAKARKLHPDVNPDDPTAEAKFKEAQRAYDVLGDLEKRKLYDQFGMAAFEGVGNGPRAGASEWSGQQGGPGPEFVDFSQFFTRGANPQAGSMSDPFGGGNPSGGGIFEDLVGRFRSGRASARRGPQPGHDLEARLGIPFLTAVRGGETTIEVTREGGARESLVVKIPPGADTGTKLRLRGRGEPSPGTGPPGDLIITVEVQRHPYFTRDGRDLLVEVPITVGEAVLGAKIEVPTLEGPKTLPIPAGTSGGRKLRLRGQGVTARGNSPAGDLFVVVKVVVPKEVDDEGRRLIREFSEHHPLDPRAGLW